MSYRGIASSLRSTWRKEAFIQYLSIHLRNQPEWGATVRTGAAGRGAGISARHLPESSTRVPRYSDRIEANLSSFYFLDFCVFSKAKRMHVPL